MAKHFDKDQDGKLNAEEFATAKKALAQGYANKFLFGLDASANQVSSNSIKPGFSYEERHQGKIPAHLGHIRVL